ncbi:hypothetical protein HKX48_008458 [Thoreauomyces humboldtii]|nr:hypothetical protein HKX48_008458 [Thoreauomyces humboldtii]
MSPLAPICRLTFANLHLEDSKPPVTSLGPEASIAQALTFMQSNSSTSVPIRSRSGVVSSISAVVGVLDIIGYLSHHPDTDLESTTIETCESLQLGDDDQTESYRIWEKDFLDTLESTLVAFARGTHRALVTDVLEKRKSYLLTQSDVVRYAASHPESVSPGIDLDLPISVSLLKVNKTVHVATEDVTAKQALVRMRTKGVGALPVVDDQGRIVANISASDIRGLGKTGLADLDVPVLDFLQKKTRSLVKPIVCAPTATLKEVMDLLVKHHIHQLWVVEDASALKPKPIGVVSRSDVIGAFVGVEAR